MKLLFLLVCALFLTIDAHSQMVNNADTIVIEEIMPEKIVTVLLFKIIEDYNIGCRDYNEPQMFITTKGLYLNVDSTLMNADLVIYITKDSDILPDILNIHIGKRKKDMIKIMKEVPFFDIHYSKEFGDSNFRTGSLEGNVIEGKKEGLWSEYNYGTKDETPIHVKNMNYSNGLLDGEYCVFNGQGDTLAITSFKQGTGNYVDFYYSSGVLKEKGQLVNGKKEGRWYFYDEEGELIKSSIYKNDYCITQ